VLRHVSRRRRLLSRSRPVASRSCRRPRPVKERRKRAIRGAADGARRHRAAREASLRSASGRACWSLPELDPAADVARHCSARYAATVGRGRRARSRSSTASRTIT
jgi:hypothetical protein